MTQIHVRRWTLFAVVSLILGFLVVFRLTFALSSIKDHILLQESLHVLLRGQIHVHTTRLDRDFFFRFLDRLKQ